MKTEVKGNVLNNIPWQDRPAKSKEIFWRYQDNPIIKKDAIKRSNSIFNSAVVSYKDGYAGVFRCDNKCRVQELHAGFSKNGIDWEIEEEPIKFICNNKEIGKFTLGYDPRVCLIEDKYYVTWCNAYCKAPTIGVAYTYDFIKFYQLENAFLPFNRNGVLFPRKINGNYFMLSRPSDNGHTPFGDIYLSQSPDMIFWGKHRFVMSPDKESGQSQWQSTKIGAGPIPIETSEGWLLIYHGVLNSCNGFVYSMGAALLDLERPHIVKYRTAPYLMCPSEDYERIGDVANVVFPCAALAEAQTGRLAVYYGAADTVTGLAFAYIDELIDFIKNNSCE